MPTLESRIAALEQSSGTKDSENQPGEVFARIKTLVSLALHRFAVKVLRPGCGDFQMHSSQKFRPG